MLLEEAVRAAPLEGTLLAWSECSLTTRACEGLVSGSVWRIFSYGFMRGREDVSVLCVNRAGVDGVSGPPVKIVVRSGTAVETR